MMRFFNFYISIIRRKLFKSEGISLVGVLAGTAVAGIVAVGLMKSLLHVTEKTTTLRKKSNFTMVKRVVMKNIRNNNAWKATVDKSSGTCWPGKNANCAMAFWHNPNNPYNTQTYINGSKKWVCSCKSGGTHDYGIGFAQLNGRPIYFSDIGGNGDCNTFNNNCGNESAFETAINNRLGSYKDRYLKVRVDKPDKLTVSPKAVPLFNITVSDVTQSGLSGSIKVTSITDAPDEGSIYTTGANCTDCSSAIGYYARARNECATAIGQNAQCLSDCADDDHGFTIGYMAQSPGTGDALSTRWNQNRIQLGTELHNLVVGHPSSTGTAYSSIYAQDIYADDIHAFDCSQVYPDFVFDKYFDSRVSEEDMPLYSDYYIHTIPEMIAYIKDKNKRHLPTLSGRAVGRISLGMRTSELWETVEVHAIYYKELWENDIELSEKISEVRSILVDMENNKISSDRENLEFSNKISLAEGDIKNINDRSFEIMNALDALEKEIDIMEKKEGLK